MSFKANIFLFLILVSINIINISSSYIKIPQAKTQQPVSENSQDFQPFEAVVKFPDLIYEKNKKINTNNIPRINEIISRIPLILKNLLLSNSKIAITYDQKLLNKMNLNCKYIKTEKLKVDLLIIVSFSDGSFKNPNTISSKLFSTSGRHSDLIEKQRAYVTLLEINSNYDLSKINSELILINNALSKVFNAMGFRQKYLLKQFIRNKFDNVPKYLVQDSKIYKSYKKFLYLKNIKIWEDPDIVNYKFYSSFWNLKKYGLNDIMAEYIIPESIISELTMKLFNEMTMFSVPKCDLFKYEAGFGRGYNCLRPFQDCIDKNMENEYFLEYGIYNNTEIKCYLNNKDNLKHNQCGIKYGNLETNFYENYFCPLYKGIKDDPLISMSPIKEIDFYKSQRLKLVKNPPSCKPGIPRTIFFSVPSSIFDQEKKKTNVKPIIQELNEINKDVQYDEVVFEEKDKKYFVTYEAYEENYIRESVTKVLNYSGVIRSFSDFNTHNLLIKNPAFSKLGEMGMIPSLQKLFSYNNFKVIANKDLTYKYYAIMSKKYPKDFTYMPPTYSYPEEKKIILKTFSNYKLSKDNLWLIKPKLGTLGDGIYIFHDLSNVPDDYIITKYIGNPHLINKLKYDFRLYVLVTGLSPLKLYLYKEGMVRFTTEEYTLDINKIDELYIHLTNVHVNKKNKKIYKKAHDADTEEGSKWSLQVYQNYCKKNGIDFHKIWEQMADIAIKSILAVRDLFLSDIEKNGTKDRNHFKLFGYDYLVDENLKVHLIEINSRPSLIMGDINDLKLKPQLIADTLNLVGITPYSHDYKDDFKAYDLENNINYKNKQEEMEDDVDRALCEFGKPRGRFELIFPIKEKVDYYKTFFTNKKSDEMLWKKL